jgi:predicted peptidase
VQGAYIIPVVAAALVIVIPAVTRAMSNRKLSKDFEKREFTDKQGNVMPYRLLKPENYDPDKKYPLVLFLQPKLISFRANCGL